MIGLRITAVILGLAGLTLAVVSIYLSYILFSNISSEVETQQVWGTAAIAFEVIKFTLVPIATYLFFKEKYGQTLLVLISLLVLMVASITASVGSLSKGTSDNDVAYYKAIDLIKTNEESISDLYAEIKERSVSIKIFQDAKKISLGAKPLQDKNDVAHKKIRDLKAENNAIEVPSRDAMSQAIQDFSIILKMDERTAKPQVFLIFAILLDFFGGVSLLVAEAIYLSINKKKEEEDTEEQERKVLAEQKAREYELETLKLQQNHEISVKKIEENRASMDLRLSENNVTTSGLKVDNTLKPIQQKKVVSINADVDDLSRAKELVARGELDNPPAIREMVKEFHFERGSAEKIRKHFQNSA